MAPTEYPMFIGKLATRTGLSIPAIRYYEAEGLLEAPRSRTKYRLYSEVHVQRLLFIQKVQGLGFTLEQVLAMLKIVDSGPAGGYETLEQMTRDKRVEFATRMEGLRQFEETLRQLTARCVRGERFTSGAFFQQSFPDDSPTGLTEG